MFEVVTRKSREPSPTLANAGARALARAVETGDASEVTRLVASGAAADVPQAGGETLLMRAAAKGHADVARALLDAGADVNARRTDGFTPLLVASFRGHAEVVRVLLERGADASVRTRLGADAGAWAASHGFAETAGLLKDAASQASATRVSNFLIDSNGTTARASSVQAATVDEREAVESRPDEVGVGARRSRLMVASVVLLVAAAGVGLYGFAWRGRLGSKRQPTAGASNVVPQALPQAAQPVPSVQPSPSASPVVAPNTPIMVNVPADVPPFDAGAAQGRPVAPGSSAPLVVIEDGAAAPTVKPTRAEGQQANTARGEATREDGARAVEESPRPLQGQGAEVRTVPVRPYTMPPNGASAPPTPEPTPKRKVIQWP